MSTYQIGQKVMATISAQGLVKGSEYEVVHTIVNSALWGTFVTYVVRGEGPQDFLHVRNGHLLLSEV